LRLARLSPGLEGAYLARSVMDGDGRVLLTAGSRLTARYIQRLLARGIAAVYVADELSEDVHPDEVVRAETRALASEVIRQAFARAERQERSLPASGLRQVVLEVIDQLWLHQGLAVDLTDMRCHIPYTFLHCLHVAVLAVLIGQALGLPREALAQLATGAILQDIGIRRYADLIRQPRALQPEEFERLQRHPEEGFRYLREQAGVDLLVAHVAYQHHERLDGSGYPRGLRGEEIHLFARIAAVADVFDALTADRPHKAGMAPHEAMGVLRGMGEDKLDPQLVRRLSEQLAVYAAGAPVLLTSGELAVVVAQGSRGPALPVVRVVADETLRVIPPYELDLGADPQHRGVRTVLPDYPRTVRRQLFEL
jgi:HD-GYP domain-containing protein (c-di-GMP phosphodiesterase class II)